MSGKASLVFSCSNCGSIFPKWVGKCTACNEWNTIIEEKQNLTSSSKQNTEELALHAINGEITSEERFSSNSSEMDRVLGGGIVAGSSILIGGEPGVGKSTLLLKIGANISKTGSYVYYFSGEESVNQIKMRASRMQIEAENFKLAFTSSLFAILGQLKQLKKGDVAIIDSIQTICHDELGSSAGSVAQVRTCTEELLKAAKTLGIAIFLVGHINKEGQIAGPKVLEHMVDVVLYFEEDLSHNFRILRNIKNRFGNIQETGIFKMHETGLIEVSNPSSIFISKNKEDKIGSIVFSGLEGTRPIMLEVETLLTPSFTSFPKRVVVGWDANRLSMITAVLQTHLKMKLHEKEVYLNLAGGLKTFESSADLAVAASIFSAFFEIPIKNDLLAFGEVSLSGEIRPVQLIEMRIKEALKLGYKTILCPKLPEESKSLLKSGEIIEVQNLKYLKYLLK